MAAFGAHALGVLVALALSASFAGCLACEPQLDVHRCRNEAGRCDLAGEVVAQWDEDLAALWPDIPVLMAEVDGGGHGHASWSEQEAEAFWRFWHVPLDRADKQVYLRHEGALYHVRILAC